MKRVFSIILFLFAITFTSNLYAALINLGGGLVYDDYSDITWLADANFAMTSGYDDNGAMSWADTMHWADTLVYAGYDDWRLPTAYNRDGSGLCLHPSACTESELGHLFYGELGGTYLSSIYDSSDPSLALFSNIVTSVESGGANYDTYWTSTPGTDARTFWTSRSMYFAFTNGTQWAKNQDDPSGHGWGVGWAVHDGRLAVVPEPSSILLLGIGILLVVVVVPKQHA